MGHWEETTTLRCSSCGAVIKERKTKDGTTRLHYYATLHGIECPSCWTTNRVHPDILKGVASVG